MKTIVCRLLLPFAVSATALSFWLATSAFAQATSPAPASASHGITPAVTPASTEVPDGSPQLAPEKFISNTSTGVTGASNPGRSAISASTVVTSEERIQGRLASARVSVGGAKGYTVVDPDAGRTDRQSDHGGKRLSPSIWELFRF